MDYYRLAKEGYPIATGEVEAANKLLVVQRLKRSGQGWGRDGGQGVLGHRALLKSGRFDRTWKMPVPKLNRSNKNREPVTCTANEKRPMGVAECCAQDPWQKKMRHAKIAPRSCLDHGNEKT